MKRMKLVSISVIYILVSYSKTENVNRPTEENDIEYEFPRALKYPCQCLDGECGCCTGNILSNFNINVQNRACVNITYFPEDFEFHVRLVFNDETFFQRRMSGKNPPPLCATLPYINAVKMCVQFSNVYIISRNLHMCLSIDGKFRENTIYSFSFDCIRVGTNGFALLKPEEGGGLGPPKPDTDNSTITEEDYDAVVASEGDDIQSAKAHNPSTECDYV